MLHEMMKQVKRAHTLHARTSSRRSDGTTTTPRAAWRREIKPVVYAASLTALLEQLLAIAGFRKKPNGDWVARESVFVERLLAPANHPEHIRANFAILEVRDFACFCGSKYAPSM